MLRRMNTTVPIDTPPQAPAPAALTSGLIKT